MPLHCSRPGWASSQIPLKNQKGRAPLEALPFTAIIAVYKFDAVLLEALPFNKPLDLALGAGDASIYEVCDCNYRQCRSNHRAPSFV
jgi:hypothetical protein